MPNHFGKGRRRNFYGFCDSESPQNRKFFAISDGDPPGGRFGRRPKPGSGGTGDAARCASRRQSGEYEYDDKKPERGAATWVAPAQARLARPATLSVAVGAALIF